MIWVLCVLDLARTGLSSGSCLVRGGLVAGVNCIQAVIFFLPPVLVRICFLSIEYS